VVFFLLSLSILTPLPSLRSIGVCLERANGLLLALHHFQKQQLLSICAAFEKLFFIHRKDWISLFVSLIGSKTTIHWIQIIPKDANGERKKEVMNTGANGTRHWGTLVVWIR
jgi:hypothetical protein